MTELTKQDLNPNVPVCPVGIRKAATIGADPKSTITARTSLHEATHAQE